MHVTRSFRNEVRMPDITMCTGGDCPLKNSCKRFVSKPDPYWQSYFTNVPYGNGCEHYWDCGNAINKTEQSAQQKGKQNGK